MSRRRLIIVVLVLTTVCWTLVPLVRGLTLLSRGSGRVTPPPSEIPSEVVTFRSSDGVTLAGTLFPASRASAAVVLVHGFKNTRADMYSYASFLHDAGYAALVYDSRGCGESQGLFGVGATEDRDIVGAVTFLRERGFAHVAVLGVSLGAGDALLAGARDSDIDAVAADSAWADEDVQVDRMGRIAVGPVSVPLLPYEAAVVDALLGVGLEDVRPRDQIARIAPRPLLLIHSADDQNATTPLADARAMFASAGEPKEMWIAPSGGHAGALGANRDEYVRRVTDFLARAFR